MKRLAKLLLYPTVMLMFAAGALADEAAIRKVLQEKIPPDMSIEKITKTPYGGLYEVFLGDKIVYTDENGSFVIDGRLIDLKTDTDVTMLRKNELSRINFNGLPLNLAIKTVKGNGKRRLAIFSDPDCPYCKRLEKEMEDITDVTIYTFLYPIDSLHPAARDKARAVWCAQDQGKAWNELMLRGKIPPASDDCQAPIQKIVDLGEKYRVSGTPTLFFANGRRVPGAVPKDQLEKMLAAAESN